jgi:hypothetical protein
MNKKNPVIFIYLAVMFSCLCLLSAPLFGWGKPIKITNDNRYTYEKPQVRFSSNSSVYISYSAKTVGANVSNVFLSRFDGAEVQFIKNVSETGYFAYEGEIGIGNSGGIHVAWAEYNQASPRTQYIKYRYYNGSSWTTTQTLGQVSTDLVEDLRMAVDSNNNVFVVFWIFPEGQCYFVSKYGGTVGFNRFQLSARSKHPDVAVDSRYVYITWQYISSPDYTILTQKRENSVNGRWLPTVDLRHYYTQRPRMDIDANGNQHVVYWHDLGATRRLFYKYWQGSGFSQEQVVSDPNNYYSYHFGDFVLKGTQMIATMQDGGYYSDGRTIFYNWAQNGVWGGLQVVPGTPALRPLFASVDMSSANNVAVAVASYNTDIYLILSAGEGPVPPPPPPTNLPPKALFTFKPINGLYPLNVTFDASNSKDSDGQIVSYRWDFGDKGKGSGVLKQHVYSAKNRYVITLTVTDDDGATDSATGEIEVFGLYPPLNLQYTRNENRNLFSIEYLYRITWEPNPRNVEVGAMIVGYKIYRQEKGHSGFSLFLAMPVSNQSKLEYLDRTLGSTAKQYYYQVTAVDSAGRESGWD